MFDWIAFLMPWPYMTLIGLVMLLVIRKLFWESA
jgi:hypothetical protein